MSKPKQVTIVEVAKEAGVSIATVSNVLNRGGIRSSKETIHKVELAAERLGYRRNTMAAGLSRNKTYELGLIVPGLNGYYGLLAEHLQIEAHNSGYHLSVFSSGGFDPEIERRNLEVLLQRRVDGLICHGLAMGFESTRSIVKSGTPLILINGWDWPEDIALGAVNLGFVDACEQSVRLLVERGCKALCYVGSKKAKAVDEQRRIGFSRGIEQYEGVIQQYEMVDAKELQVDAFLRNLHAKFPSPVGIVAFDDHVALRIISAAHKLGIELPSQLKIVGINNDYIAEHCFPGLTSWDIPYTYQAKMAIGKLHTKLGQKGESEGSVENLDDFDPSKMASREINVPLTLIERSTTNS
ncbi:LacI family transcriptional regulator [Paenibacillus sp. SYP-B3998]|uniref:LacI family transcriptional regulator n=1 Tax=Paenibacillus sp. SYP-B3998 TaxID=2678564 RepID=A0A6G3ZW78_9BACL|nr:LacI family DNA-binding transcriptional regulator [Paenibacillus sp. SYP-B3998]NEW06330.1 LacI family transcriptional regulator [Paenibacillus sp. SYP-B3998]